MKRFFLMLVFFFGLPFLFYEVAMWTLIPLFGIHNFAGGAAFLFSLVPDLICWLIGWWISHGAPLPDNGPLL